MTRIAITLVSIAWLSMYPARAQYSTGEINVFDYMTSAQIADVQSGTASIDVSTALQNAANAIPSQGGTLKIPAGTYKYMPTIFLKSNTYMTCLDGATFKPNGYGVSFSSQNGTRNILTDTTPTTPINQTDHDITVDGCRFDFTTVPMQTFPIGQAAVQFYLGTRMRAIHNQSIGGTALNNIAGEFRCMGIDGCELAWNYGLNGGTLDVFKGSTNVAVHDNIIVTIPGNSLDFGPFACIAMNGAGANPVDQEATHSFVIKDNFCYSNGYATAINADALGPGSAVADGTISGNVITALSGTKTYGVLARGYVKGLHLSNNTFNNLDWPAVLTGQAMSNKGNPFSANNVLSTVSGSSNVYVDIPTFNASNVAVGNYILLSASPVGGLTFGGFYSVVGTMTGRAVVSVAPAVASATASAAGGSITAYVYTGVTRDTTVSNTAIYNSGLTQEPFIGQALVDARGPGISVSNTVAQGGPYGVVVNVDQTDLGNSNPIRSIISGTTGYPGSGNVGTNNFTGAAAIGDGLNSYTSGASQPPLIIDNLGPLSPRVVSALPTCNSTKQGARGFVTDATSATFLTVVAGGSSQKVPVLCDGINWVVGG